VALVELVAVRLPDAVHQLHLQRNDRHRRERFGQQLERAVQDRGVAHGLVELGLGHRRGAECAAGGRRGRGRGAGREPARGPGCAGAARGRSAGPSRGTRPGHRVELDRQRPGERRVDDRVGLLGDHVRVSRVEPERARERREELALGRAARAVGVAHTHRHLVGELSQPGVAELRRGGFDGHLPRQHALVERGQVRLAGGSERLDDATHLVALAVVLASVGERGRQRDREDRLLLVAGHVGLLGRWNP
jgi:hypothetical protein